MAPKPPPPLVDYLRTGRCVLFAGSGLSAWAKLPTWKELLQDIVREVPSYDENSSEPQELARLFEAGKLLEIADHCKEKLGEQRYSEILTTRLSGNQGDIPEAHKLISQMPFAAVVTTNYDKLLERAYASTTNGIPKAPTHLDLDTLGPLLFSGSFFILKAHGDIDRPGSLILTTRDYREIIHSNPAFNAIFSAILLTKSIFFIGYSLSDPDFRLLLDRQLTLFKGHIPDRYALMTGIGNVEREVLWRTARIRILPYPEKQHGEVLVFLRDLLKEVKKAPSAPAVHEMSEMIPKELGNLAAPAIKLSIQLNGQRIESTITVDERITSSSGSLPDWPQLTEWLRKTIGYSSESGPREVGQALAKCLSEEVLTALRQIPQQHLIVLQLSYELAALPWEWILIDDDYLLVRNPVVRAPIGVSDKARGYPLIRQPVRVLLIGDPNKNLPGARSEVRKIAAVYRKDQNIICKSLVGADASFDAVVTELRSQDYDVVHFAGHAWFDAQESFFTLHGDVMLRASEFQSFLSQRPPAILFLNSHFTSFIPPGVSSEETKRSGPTLSESGRATASGRMAFTEVATTTGVGAFIGCFGHPSDAVAEEIGIQFHRALLKGYPVASALYKARLTASKGTLKRSNENLTWLFYVASGYGELVLPVSPHKD
ncbi:MAG TPA: SIR2 family protein [Thermoanaerobaculia bacterium]